MKKHALKVFRQPPERLNCAQSVLHAWREVSDDTGIALADLKPFGGGRAPDGLCGALHAACMVAPGRAEALKQNFAARLGSRYAIVRGATACPGGSPSPDPLQAYIVGQSPGIVPSALTVTTTCSSPANGCSSSATPWNGAGCVVRVRVNYSFRFLVPLVSTLVIPMTSSSEMVISQ